MFSELFANNVFVKLLRGDAGRYNLIVSMIGVKLGERLLLIGGGNGALLAALGAKTGLTGTIAAIEADKPRAEQVLREATKAGVLADVYAEPQLRPPYDASSFDIVVIPFPPLPEGQGEEDGGPELGSRIGEAFRVLRDGGRCAIVARAGKSPAPAAAAPIPALLQQQGFRAARVLAERNGLVFYEGVKK